MKRMPGPAKHCHCVDSWLSTKRPIINGPGSEVFGPEFEWRPSRTELLRRRAGGSVALWMTSRTPGVVVVRREHWSHTRRWLEYDSTFRAWSAWL